MDWHIDDSTRRRRSLVVSRGEVGWILPDSYKASSAPRTQMNPLPTLAVPRSIGRVATTIGTRGGSGRALQASLYTDAAYLVSPMPFSVSNGLPSAYWGITYFEF